MAELYKILWDTCPAFYFGSSANANGRFKTHLALLLRNKHHSYKLQKFYNQYGAPRLEVLKEYKKDKTARKRELRLIATHGTDIHCCNVGANKGAILRMRGREAINPAIAVFNLQAKGMPYEYREKLQRICKERKITLPELIKEILSSYLKSNS